MIHRSRYARYVEEEKRRETWEETVSRYIDYFKEKHNDPKIQDMLDQAWVSIFGMEVMPSMRALMTAGPALDKDNIAGYNCAYLPIDHPRAFDETLYILLCGTGVGFSVERQYIQKLPEVPDEFHDTDTVIVVADSKIGWASAFRELLSLLWSGKVPRYDLSRVRPAGARLRTFGGRASGPEPLEDLFKFTINLFRNAHGRKLTSLECHDLVCKVAQIVVVGGVRRSALISLSNLSDQRMRNAKTGKWWEMEGQRALSNNSVAYTEKPDMATFLTEMHSMYHSYSGERGIFNRVAAKRQVQKLGRRDPDHEWGCNPCSEIILRPYSFCNLSEVVVRAGDDLESLKRKVRVATFLGTLQSALTSFRYIRKTWRDNCEDERLLGVSLTGIMDHKTLSNPGSKDIRNWLESLKDEAIKENRKWASILGINQSAAITCVRNGALVA
jgi:ribonucleoside-diphosphate reductase alpha chain